MKFYHVNVLDLKLKILTPIFQSLIALNKLMFVNVRSVVRS